MDETLTDAARVEVHLEELGQHSWWKALLNTLTGTDASAQYRFVARPAGAPDVAGAHLLEGATFTLLRWQDLDDEHQPDELLETPRRRLAELDASLRSDGWTPCGGLGRHWWSRTYEHTV